VKPAGELHCCRMLWCCFTSVSQAMIVLLLMPFGVKCIAVLMMVGCLYYFTGPRGLLGRKLTGMVSRTAHMSLNEERLKSYWG
jgi:hypothetical protein